MFRTSGTYFLSSLCTFNEFQIVITNKSVTNTNKIVLNIMKIEKDFFYKGKFWEILVWRILVAIRTSQHAIMWWCVRLASWRTNKREHVVWILFVFVHSFSLSNTVDPFACICVFGTTAWLLSCASETKSNIFGAWRADLDTRASNDGLLFDCHTKLSIIVEWRVSKSLKSNLNLKMLYTIRKPKIRLQF